MISEKEKKVRDYREKLLESIVKCKVKEFNKVTKTPKEELFSSIEKDVENCKTKAKLCIDSNDGVIKGAESLVSSTQAPQVVQVQKNVGFRGAVPVNAWMYISPFISPTGWPACGPGR